ncbi:hypothetical protein M3J07_009140 [Ascochyta lentis]
MGTELLWPGLEQEQEYLRGPQPRELGTEWWSKREAGTGPGAGAGVLSLLSVAATSTLARLWVVSPESESRKKVRTMGRQELTSPLVAPALASDGLGALSSHREHLHWSPGQNQVHRLICLWRTLRQTLAQPCHPPRHQPTSPRRRIDHQLRCQLTSCYHHALHYLYGCSSCLPTSPHLSCRALQHRLRPATQLAPRRTGIHLG